MKNEDFLREQLALLKRKEEDPTLEWQDIVDFRTDALGFSEHRDSVRKGYKLLGEYVRAGWVNDPADVSHELGMSEDIIALKKERVKLSDARVEYNRQIRQEARKESYLEMVQRVICKETKPIVLDVDNNFVHNDNDNDLIVALTDLHVGIEIDLWCNQFDENIFKQRIEKYTSKIIEIQTKHNSENCYIIAGELVSGIIHNNLRLQNNMDLMDQFKIATEVIASMLIELSKYFHTVSLYMTPGNHSRISPKKEDALDGENMDIIAAFYLQARLQNFTNIFIHDNRVEREIAMFDVRGNFVCAAHGHKDRPETVVQNFTMMFGKQPNIVYLGHRHTNAMTTVYNTKVIESGCVSGSDSFAVSIRKTNKPEQTVSVVDENGLVCLYDIQLDN